jgi:acyl-CoA dehydrogenase
MIAFTLTDEQKNLRELAHEFARKEIRPVAWEYDRDGTWPEAVIAKAHEIGLMNTHIPEQYRGAGLSALDACLIDEQLAWGCSGIASAIGANGLAGITSRARRLGGGKARVLRQTALAAHARLVLPHQARRWLGRRRDAHPRVRKGDKYLLTGAKSFIDEIVEQRERRAALHSAVAALPSHERQLIRTLLAHPGLHLRPA